MSGFGRIILIGSVVATVAGIVSLRAQTQLSDPKDAPRIFASTCSACHKSPQGLAKSGQVAGFLRQHYTTSPEMSASMAAYLVSAGSGPAPRKGKEEQKTAAFGTDNPAPKGKKKQEQVVIQPGNERLNPDPVREAKERRAKQLQAKAQEAKEERTPVHPSPASAADAAARQAVPAVAAAAAVAAPAVAVAEGNPAASPEAAPAGTPAVTLDIPLPEMPTEPPADLTQSVFSSSPVP